MRQKPMEYGGEFHLFHLIDPETGKESPTACASVRMARGAVAEISGLKGDKNQYLEDSLVPTVEEKVRALPGGDRYLRAFTDKQLLIAMDRKFAEGEDFTVEELEFLYELERKIEYIDTYNSDPRPDQFKGQRKERNEAILREKYSAIDTHVLMNEEIGRLASIDQLVREGVSGPLLLSRISPGKILENIDTLQSAGNTLDVIVGRMYGSSIIENIELLEARGAKIDIDAAVATSHAEVIAANLPMLQERGAHIDMEELDKRLSSYVTMKYIGNLVDAGMDIDLNTVVERNGADNALKNLDEVVRVGAKVDLNWIVREVEDVNDVYRGMSALLRHGVDPQLLLQRYMSKSPVLAVASFPELTAAGANIDIDELVDSLAPYEKAQYLSELQQFGASIDTDKLVQDLGGSAISYMSHLQEAGVKLDVNVLIKNAPNTASLIVNMEALVKSGADIDTIMGRLGGMPDSSTSGIQGRAMIGKLLKLGADREKIKQVFNLSDERIDGLEAEANEIIARTAKDIAEGRVGIGRYRQ